jgi:hypothetical protein
MVAVKSLAGTVGSTSVNEATVPLKAKPAVVVIGATVTAIVPAV